jgi:ferric-dicitrate binding protein FerR (iron transport regulator)
VAFFNPPSARRWQRWAPAGALAASVLAVALLVARVPGTPGVVSHATGGGEDIELLADSDALALAQEPEVDYDFYEWAVDADAQDVPAPAVGS